MHEGAYQTTSLIRESQRTVVERGRRASDGREVVIKTAAARVPPAESLPRYRNEWFITRMFDAPCVVRSLEIIESANATALVFEPNPGFVALDERVAARAGRLGVRECLTLALALVDALATIHAKGIVHKDLKPSNLLVDVELARVVLIDFGIATVVPRGLGRRAIETRFEGTPGYAPPEQTGRINCAVDYRSDYYGLGACLHWMLVGEPPFAELRDHAEYVHALLTRAPPLLTERRAELPRVLAAIVAKLLSPAIEDRYQGSFGLRADLSRCLATLDEQGEIPDFPLASRDPSERLRRPSRLHGRERERALLLDAHARAQAEGPRLVVVRGPSGSGKSALVNELRDAIAEPTVFARCKFDQYAQSSAHTGVGRVLGGLLRELAGASQGAAERLRARLHEAVGPNGALLRDLVPELEDLLGTQLEVAKVGPAEARDRFWDTLERFVDALLMSATSVVIVVDDAQWADSSSLRLIETLMHARARPLTLVLTTRDDALADASHPLARMLADLGTRGLVAATIELAPLSLAAIDALLHDVLAVDAQSESETEIEALAQLLHERSGGMPLFLEQLLITYYDEGILDVDRTRGQWRVDLDRALGRESSGAVVEFLVDQLRSLPARTRRILGIAACIGSRFDLDTLAAASGHSIAEIGPLAWDAVASGHLVPFGSSASSGDVANTRAGTQLEYGFAHDRIQQLALEDLPDERGLLYLGLARRLLGRARQGESIHALAAHIARALDHVEDPEEAARFVDICVESGARAKAAARFDLAADHYASALRLAALAHTPDDATFAHTLELGECLTMTGELAAAELHFERAATLVRDALGHARLLLTRVTLAMVPGDTARALDLVMDAAARFDLDLRRAGSAEWMAGKLSATIARIETIGAMSIVSRPAASEPLHGVLTHLLLASTNAAYLAGDIHLYAALGLTIIDRGLEQGIDAGAGVAFVQLAIIAATSLADYEAARRYCAVGFALLERFPEPSLEAMSWVIKGSTIQPWVEPLAASLPMLRRAHVRLRATGMLTNAGYASFCVLMNSFAIGRVLPLVVEDAEACAAYLESIGDRPLLAATRAHIVACERLSSTSERAQGAGIYALADVERNPASHHIVHALHALTSWMLDEPAGLEAALEAMGPSIAAGTGMYLRAVYEVVALAHACTRYSTLDAAARRELEREVESASTMLARWSASCPDNADPLRHLLAAQWARARGRLDEARDAYTAAADAAAASGMLGFEGLANERGAEVLLELGQPRYALGYLEHARRSYARWGAHALERRVVERLRTLGHAPASASPERGTITPSVDVHALDLAGIVKMSLALSEATELDGVIRQLLAQTRESGGADRSAVLLTRAGTLELHAIEASGTPLHRFDPPLALDDAGELLARALVRECLRDGAAVIVDDARGQLGERRDPYLLRAGVRSALALPIIKRSQTIGVVYLENRVTPGTFMPQHLHVLASLAAQAAVSIDNARLFDTLREREAQWRSLVDNAPDAIIIVDRARRVEFSNRPSIAEVGAIFEAALEPQDRTRACEAIDYVFATGHFSSFEFTRASATGRRRLMTRLGPISRDDTIERVTLISSDVTAQRELELQLRQAQKMQAVGNLAGGIAHDFNNILTIIMGACELGMHDLHALGVGGDALAIESFLDIGEAATRAAKLTRQLLAFSRKQVLQPTRFDLSTLVRDVSRLLTRLIGEDISLVLELDGEPCGVHVDPGQLEQVIMNLVVNARDAMPRGGTLTISTRRCSLDASTASRPAKLEPGAYIELAVSDTGTGIAPDVLQAIFEPFFTTKPSGQGTGLGLSTVHGIVEQSGGHIDVSSELGHGARFRVLLPADTSDAEGLRDEQPSAVLPRGTETLLVVEDEEALARLAAQILGSLGYRVVVAGDYETAIRAAQSLDSLDLLISDVVLPGPSGVEVAAAIAELHPGVEVLYTSGYTNDAVVRHGVQAGSVALLQKPYTREALAVRVRRLLDGVDDVGSSRP